MLTTTVPPSSSLSDIASYIDFIKLIATSDGLAAALEEVRKERAGNDEILVEIRNQREANAAELSDLAARRAEMESIIKTANEKTLAAQEQMNAAEDLYARALKKEKEVADTQTAVEADFSKRQKQLAADEERVQQLEATAVEKLDQANAIRSDYEEKLARLRETVK